MNNPFFVQMLPQFRRNPLLALRQAGYSMPANLQDPQTMIQHLLSSGQITQAQLQNAQMTARRMGF